MVMRARSWTFRLFLNGFSFVLPTYRIVPSAERGFIFSGFEVLHFSVLVQSGDSPLSCPGLLGKCQPLTEKCIPRGSSQHRKSLLFPHFELWAVTKCPSESGYFNSLFQSLRWNLQGGLASSYGVWRGHGRANLSTSPYGAAKVIRGMVGGEI